MSAVPVPNPDLGRARAADRARGRRPEPDQPAERVPLPPALPALRRGPLRRRGAAARAARRHASRRLPLPARALADDRRGDAPRPRRSRAEEEVERRRQSRRDPRRARRALSCSPSRSSRAASSPPRRPPLRRGPGRALAVGWYASGRSCSLIGFVVGERGPRAVDTGAAPVSRGRAAVGDAVEQEEVADSAVLVALGVVLLVLGVAVDGDIGCSDRSRSDYRRNS